MAEPSLFPRVFLWDTVHLLTVADEARFAPALERLRQEADETLAAGPFSVMDKPRTPPGGDKHDYMSMGPYWWPNPDTPDGLPYIRRDGERNPEGDALDRRPLEQMQSSVITLSLAFYLTGHAPYAEHAARLLRVWFLNAATRMNPHLEYGQSIPGICDGRGIGIIDTRRFGELADAVALLETWSRWEEADRDGMRGWMKRYLDWLLRSAHGRREAAEHNNHGTWYDVQAATLTLFLGERETARRILYEVPERRITAHIAPDGSQPHELARTRALSYSIMNLTGLFDLAALAYPLGLDFWQVGDNPPLLRRALDYLLPFALGEKPWPHPQITEYDAAGALLPLVLRAARAYPDAGYGQAIARLPLPDAAAAAHRAHLFYF